MVGPNGPELRATKTHRTYRVELDAETFNVLMAHRSDAEARAQKLGVELAVDSFVFSSHRDGSNPWLPNWLTKQFTSLRRAAGLPHFRLHDLRHFMASEMPGGRHPHRHCLAAAQPRARIDHAQRVRTLHPRGRSESGRDSRGDPRSWAWAG